ncbi:DUF177 domain-containing protein [Pyruvatibacter mobilis]|uniref:DUF177 domain-containing protein n=1 Tax=Pyruvatibacter mobilis TaxID=1712261 RepID=UPI003C7E95A1
MVKKTNQTAPEFSFPVDIASLPQDGVRHFLEPNEKERAAIAKRLELQALPRLTVEIDVTPSRGKGALLRGRLEADVVQTCVVSLDAVPAQVSDRFEVRFLPAELIEDVSPGEDLELSSEEDAPEPLGGPNGTSFDAGEVAVQYLSLALDPYPRLPDAVIPEEAVSKGEPSPFAVLKALKTDGKPQ